MKNLPECVLTIYIPNQGEVEQGKACQIDGKPCFVANMTPAKWFRIGGGYTISKRILDALLPGTKIIFNRKDLNTHYVTNKSKFRSKGILVFFGGHSQWSLPLSNWKAQPGTVRAGNEGLPLMRLSDWKKPMVEKQTNEVFQTAPSVMMRLKDEFRQKYA